MHWWTWAVVGVVVLGALGTLALVGRGTLRHLDPLSDAQIRLQARQVDLAALNERVDAEILDPLEMLQLRMERTSEQVALLKAKFPTKSDKSS
jgi:hypothetical protein